MRELKVTRRTSAMTKNKATKRDNLFCAGCSEQIFGVYQHDLTGQTWHRVCKRMKINKYTMSYAPQRYQGTVQQECGGCGQLVAEEDQKVHVNAVPWHTECFRNR